MVVQPVLAQEPGAAPTRAHVRQLVAEVVESFDGGVVERKMAVEQVFLVVVRTVEFAGAVAALVARERAVEARLGHVGAHVPGHVALDVAAAHGAFVRVHVFDLDDGVVSRVGGKV